MKNRSGSVLGAVCAVVVASGACLAHAGSPAPVTVYSQPGWCTWCPTPTRLPDGRFALVHSRWPEKCGFESWCMKSEIALAVADSALGPYCFVGTLLGGAGTPDAWDRDVTHNPYLFCHGGKYYLYYMGTRGTEGDRKSFLSSQRIGVAVADRAEGPWRRAEKPVFPEDPRRAMCSNPSVCAMPDGRILMVYKWMVAPWSTRPEVYLGAAIAPRPEGPFEIVNENVFPAAGVRFAGEDPCLWTEGGKVVCVIHDMGTNYSPHSRALVRFESEDGVRWTNCGALLARGDIHRLERPYVLALPEGERLLFAASKPSAAGESSEIVAYPGLLARESVRVEVPPQLFREGGWKTDVQFMDLVGSPYLLAHGMGLPVPDATAEVTFPKTGRYRLWVRTKNWADGAPGRFKVLVNGVGEHVFGAGKRAWVWEDGGTVEVASGHATVALRDLTGFDGRCAGVVFTDENGAAPVGALDVRTRPVDETVTVDLVVVGGGPAGCAAALAAARRGLSVAIVQDRPVLGGNGSGEIRVGFEGEVRYPIVRELAGLAGNQGALADYSDRCRLMLFEREPTLRTCLCNRAFGVEKAGEAIAAVKAFDWKHDRIVRYAGRWFCDATGDGWIGFWAGADWRMGREAKAEHGETYAPEKADGDTLGASIMWSSRLGNQDVPFSVPWAEPHAQGGAAVEGDWDWEHGIHRDQIAEAEEIRDRLLLAIYGAFSLAKKDPANSRRVLDGVPFLLGKRESRRLLGDWIFSGNDVEKKTFFEDAVVTGSWSVDLHYEDKVPGVDYLTTCRQPHYGRYWIPYRSLYSRNVPNLFMAGRCFSCTHVGLGSPRVMNTLAQMGVVVGEAAALCKETGLSPRGLFAEGKMRELQGRLGGDFPGNVLPARRNWKIVDDETVDLGPAWKKCWQCSGGQCGDMASCTTMPYEKQPKAVYPLPVDVAGDYTIYRRVPWIGWVAPGTPKTHVDIVSGGKTVETSFNPLVGDGEWVKLGTFRLEPGAQLVIDPAKSSGNLLADGFAIDLLAPAKKVMPQSLNRDARFDNAVLRATTDHADALYRCGEKMVFTLNAEGVKSPAEGAYYLDWKQQRDDGTERSGVEAFDPASPKVFETSIDRPGFVRYSFTLLGADKRPIYKSKDGTWGPIAIICECGAGAEPEKLDFPPEPKDFDAFWGKQLAELRKVPRNAKVEKIPFKDAGFDCYRLSIPCAGGRPVTGYMTVPKGPKDAKWPLNISFHGYGTFTQTAPKSGPKDKIDISINAHGYDLDRESDYYKEFWNGVKLNERGQYGMAPADNARPETSYFRGMVLRAVRAVEWAKTLPNWDGKNLRVWGGSQGGMQSLWVAALVDGITELEPIVPWGADIIGKTKGRYSFSGLRLEYAPGLDYYDTVNFAKRIPATCRVNISRSGLGDIHCPPSGQWLLYRAIKAPKSITFLQNSNHGGAPGGKEKNQHTTYSEGVAKDATKSTESSATSLLGDAWRETK